MAEESGVGTTIDGQSRYELSREIASGGMGTVYEARQQGAEGFVKTMAVKTILPRFSTNREFVDLFIGEAKLVADLVHQNIVQIYQLGRSGDTLYIAMEYIDGINLEEFMDRHLDLGRNVPIEIAAFIISRVCRALEYAHSKTDENGTPLGIVHRDVSPKNVMITSEGVVKLTDFGVAKAVRHMDVLEEGEVLMGKVEYMSPEQASYLETDARSDVFSLGVVCYELLTGQQLFEAEEVFDTLERCKRMPIRSPRELREEIPEALEEIVMKALIRERTERYQTASEMGYDLEFYMYHDRFGPTNVTLAEYLGQVYPERSFGGSSVNSAEPPQTGRETQIRTHRKE